MDINDLIQVFDEVLNQEHRLEINKDTHYKESEEWSSLSAFMVTGLLYDKFQLKVRGNVFRKSDTIAELFELIKG